MYQALPLPDLAVKIPENYQKTSSRAYEEYYVCEDASIILTEDTSQGYYASAYDYSVSALNQYEKATTSIEFLSSESTDSGCQFPVQLLEFNYTLGEGDDAARMTCMAGYMTDNAVMYIITCKSNTDTYQSHRDEFLQVMHTVAVSKGG